MSPDTKHMIEHGLQDRQAISSAILCYSWPTLAIKEGCNGGNLGSNRCWRASEQRDLRANEGYADDSEGKTDENEGVTDLNGGQNR